MILTTDIKHKLNNISKIINSNSTAQETTVRKNKSNPKFIVTFTEQFPTSRATTRYLAKRTLKSIKKFCWSGISSKAQLFEKYDTAYRMARKYNGNVVVQDSNGNRTRKYTNTMAKS